MPLPPPPHVTFLPLPGFARGRWRGRKHQQQPKSDRGCHGHTFPNPYRSRAVEPFRPTSPFLSFYRQANRLFEDVFRDFEDTREAFSGILAPDIDVIQSEQETRITAELPGVKEDDIDVSVNNDVLTIRAEKRIEREQGQDTRHLGERAYGTFQRSLRLPQPVNPDQVRAHFDHGVLTVRLPRNGEDHGRQRIAIESGPPSAAQEGARESRH